MDRCDISEVIREGYRQKEAKSSSRSQKNGNAYLYDPVEKKNVAIRSYGEWCFFWTMRFEKHVEKIWDHVPLIPSRTVLIAEKVNKEVPRRLITTDFVIRFDNGRYTAYCLKKTPDSVISKAEIEKEYWEQLEVEYRVLCEEEMKVEDAVRIAGIMLFYEPKRVRSVGQMYRYLIAHHLIDVDLTKSVSFTQFVRENEAEIREMYRKAVSE